MTDKKTSKQKVETQTTLLEKKLGVYNEERHSLLEIPQYTEEEIEKMCLEEGV